MNCEFAEMTVLMPVTQYVKVEAAANEDSRSPESAASFLLSEWVLATRKKQGAGHRSRVTRGTGKGGTR